ncbi:Crp/Fnr family transcriptional regulator [uncultured Jannaschia sp.]|uniref:Crp/Fnr family transcriptional regulator n=1 Tax=uncultured Jannaschia sp. TaxID=293347 RepID=UPI00260A4C04|nr:Crp/Fnr family transcriptional regulator [uncultured Jannaschia sp.]
MPGKTVIAHRNEPLSESLLLAEGMIGRHVASAGEGATQLVALQVPGDFVDLHGFPIGTLDHEVRAVSDVRMAVFPHAALAELVRTDPGLTIALWGMTIIDAAIHRYWSFRIGALRGMARVANFLAEMDIRLRQANAVIRSSFDLPLTQAQIGAACGMTSVHVNRVLRDLRETGCCVMRNRRVSIHDRDALQRIGQFDPTFLQLHRP